MEAEVKDEEVVGKKLVPELPSPLPPRCWSTPSVSKVTPPTPQLIFYTASVFFAYQFAAIFTDLRIRPGRRESP